MASSMIGKPFVPRVRTVWPVARMVRVMKGKVNVRWHSSSAQSHQNGRIEFRIILLNVLRSVLLPEPLDHRIPHLGIGQGSGSELCFPRSRINPNRTGFENVLVPFPETRHVTPTPPSL